jgi:hypothetical protein
MKKYQITPTWGYIQLSKNKYFEYQFEGPSFTKYSNYKFEWRLNWTEKQDHAGIVFIFSIKGLFFITCNIYDCRHWNSEKDNWHER